MLLSLLLTLAVQAPTPVLKKKGASPPPPASATATNPPVEEEFDDNRRVWLEGSNADFEARMENGRYVVTKKTAGGTLYTWIGVDVDPTRPYTLTTRFTNETGGDNTSRVGVVWSLRDRTTFNGVYMTRSGLTTWGHNTDGQWTADSAWNNNLAAGRAFFGCNQGAEGTFEVKIEPFVPPSSDRRGNRLVLSVNRCVLAILPYRYKGRNFGFVINGTATISVERFAVT